MKQPATLKHLVDLVDQIEKDQAQRDAELRRRDRPIGIALSTLAATPLAQLSAWLDKISDHDAPSVGRRVVAALRVGTLLLVVAGLGLGWLTAAGVFYYDGSQPVNIINALAVFVGFQLLLLLFTGLTFLPDNVLQFFPGMRSLRETFSLFSPGRLPRIFSRFLPDHYKTATATFWGEACAHRALYGRVEKWLVLRTGQAFGVAFNLGALAGCLYMVVFSDLAFGWSTTLQLDASALKTLTDGLAWPWAGLLPAAQPSLELLETTRYFRFQTGTLPGLAGSDPAVLGEWWPFIILCLLVYGLLPRILTLTISAVRLRGACRQSMLHLPGVQAIFDRLNSQRVETWAEQPETAQELPLDGSLSRFAGELRGQTIEVVDWGGTGLDREHVGHWLQDCWAGTLAGFNQAGGAFSLDHDRQVLQEISSASAGPIMLLVKSWEPPMAEFKDFIYDLRQHVGRVRPVAVVPVGIGSSNLPLPPDPENSAVWATVVKQRGDPWTFIAPPAQAGGD